jgi:hypothetical protein
MHILIYEPRLGGHHLSWLRYVTEDLLLHAGHRLTLAIDGREAGHGRSYQEHLGDLLNQVAVTSVYRFRQPASKGRKLNLSCPSHLFRAKPG